MRTSPGLLDPDDFESPEEFQKAELESGLAMGWTPIAPAEESLEQSDISAGADFVEVIIDLEELEEGR